MKKKNCVLIDMHTKSQQCVAGKFFAVLIFFLSRRTEVPQCSGQACFDGEREERGNPEKETGQERGKTGVRVDLKQYKEETGREGKGGENEKRKKRMAAHFTSPCLLGFLLYLTQF